MVWINVLLSKLKLIFVKLVELFRYILCSKKNRRRLSADFVPLSSIGIVSEDKLLEINTDDVIRVQNISSNSFNQVRNVQDHINYYRQQKCQQIAVDPVEEILPDFFQDMQPTITRQQKVLVKSNEDGTAVSPVSSRLSIAPTCAIPKLDELTCWEDMENTGNWEVDEINTKQLIREQRLLEREKRMTENMNKRADKNKVRFGSKIS